MIFTSDYSQKLNISRVKMFSESFLRNIKINKYNSNERNKDIKDRTENNHLNKNLFKLI